ncbi:MAG: AAA family ATPase [Longimicrobiaceae bacterium]
MFIHHVKVSGLLSFGPNGLDLALHPLNVLIGPNGSGKSNLLEVLALLRAAPSNLATPVKEVGGIDEWLWKGHGSLRDAFVEVLVNGRNDQPAVRHGLEITEHGRRFEVVDEWIETGSPRPDTDFYYRFNHGQPVLMGQGGAVREMKRESIHPEESILSQVRDPEAYPVLFSLQERYAKIRLYRNWSFGPAAPWRGEQSTHARGDLLRDGGENLVQVLFNLHSRIPRELIASLRKLFEGIEDLTFSLGGGNVQLFLKEDGKEIPASRLSDGTLRYLALLAILLHPDPPPVLAIEEPELGLHPDVIPHIAELLVRASTRTQLVVTTHSRMLVDALSDQPSSVVVCEQENGASRFRRLEAEPLRAWLDEYSLGTLWSMGQLGGNRW